MPNSHAATPGPTTAAAQAARTSVELSPLCAENPPSGVKTATVVRATV
jgi:hypothetical protein